MEEYKISNAEQDTENKLKLNTKTWIILVVAILVVVAIVVICFTVDGGNSSTSINKITYENYAKITNGMTYSQVKNILGEGEESLSSGYGNYTLTYYTWTNLSGTAVITVGFQNGKVCAKSQIGL